MIAFRVPVAARATPDARAWLESALVVAGLGAVVAARFAATRAGLDPILVGAGFGLALLGLVPAAGGRLRLGPRAMNQALAGAAVGLALVAVVLLASRLAGSTVVPGLARPASAFAPWALVAVVVAVAEEAVLRGLLFDRLRRSGDTLLALALTTVVFALMHVPLYGWHVLPLDLAVGVVLGMLRASTGSVVAPATAHVIADWAGWFLR